jgi:hypothetical protein
MGADLGIQSEEAQKPYHIIISAKPRTINNTEKENSITLIPEFFRDNL